MAKEYILKDRYGKDHTYNDEKIYVRGTDGELMPFTQGTVEPLTITENGTYAAPDGVSYNPVNVNVEPVLQDKTITENGEYTADAGYDGLGKVTVEVAGSGGGSLPAGGYFEQISPAVPLGSASQHFLLNGELYYAGGSGSYSFYKFANGAYETILTGQQMHSGINNVIEYKGRVHFFYNACHYTFDGTAVTQEANTPVELSKPIVVNGKLYAYNFKGYYVYDDASSTWIETGMLKSYNYGLYEVNGELYSFYLRDIYKVDLTSGVATKIKTCDFSPYAAYVSASGDWCLCNDNGGYGQWYTYDVEKNDLVPRYFGMPLGTYFYHYVYNGEDRFGGKASGFYKMHVRLHIVEE